MTVSHNYWTEYSNNHVFMNFDKNVSLYTYKCTYMYKIYIVMIKIDVDSSKFFVHVPMYPFNMLL